MKLIEKILSANIILSSSSESVFFNKRYDQKYQINRNKSHIAEAWLGEF